MAHNNQIEPETLSALLSEEQVRAMTHELGIADESQEVQAQIFDMLGQNIFEQIVLDVLKVLPASERDRFESFVGTGDITGLRIFLQGYVPDVDVFFRDSAATAYRAVTERIAKIKAEGK